jgi:Flp pilus assembly protein TadD
VRHHEPTSPLVAQGALAEALAEFCLSHTIAQKLVAQDPNNARWQRGLAASHEQIGDVRVAQGALDEALAAYRQCLEIVQR